MLDHELAIIMQAERERAIREARLFQDLPERPSRLAGLARTLMGIVRPRSLTEPRRDPRAAARDLANAVSARPAGADRHGAC
jgi:hypothetical protein